MDKLIKGQKYSSTFDLQQLVSNFADPDCTLHTICWKM